MESSPQTTKALEYSIAPRNDLQHSRNFQNKLQPLTRSDYRDTALSHIHFLLSSANAGLCDLVSYFQLKDNGAGGDSSTNYSADWISVNQTNRHKRHFASKDSSLRTEGRITYYGSRSQLGEFVVL